MRAMIFAAGLGTRLKPFTNEHPKVLVPLHSVPMLQRVILKLKAIGVSEFVVNVHHFAGQIIDFLKANDNFGLTIHISDESHLLLDTGGGVLAARKWLDVDDEPFIVHNADIYTDVDIMLMAECHAQSNALSTLLVAHRDTSRYLLFNDNMRLEGWENVKTGQVKPEGLKAERLTPYAFAGIHIMSPSIFPALAAYKGAGEPFSITDFYIDNCTAADFSGYISDKPYYWHDIGKPESLAAAEAIINGVE